MMEMDNKDFLEAIKLFGETKANRGPQKRLLEARIVLERYMGEYKEENGFNDPDAAHLLDKIYRRMANSGVSRNYPR